MKLNCLYSQLLFIDKNEMSLGDAISGNQRGREVFTCRANAAFKSKVSKLLRFM